MMERRIRMIEIWKPIGFLISSVILIGIVSSVSLFFYRVWKFINNPPYSNVTNIQHQTIIEKSGMLIKDNTISQEAEKDKK